MSDLREIETLIANHINAVCGHERLFTLEDWGLPTKEEVSATIELIDAALVALCAARPDDAAAVARRAACLKAKVPGAIYGERCLTEAVIAALVGGV